MLLSLLRWSKNKTIACFCQLGYLMFLTNRLKCVKPIVVTLPSIYHVVLPYLCVHVKKHSVAHQFPIFWSRNPLITTFFKQGKQLTIRHFVHVQYALTSCQQQQRASNPVHYDSELSLLLLSYSQVQFLITFAKLR